MLFAYLFVCSRNICLFVLVSQFIFTYIFSCFMSFYFLSFVSLLKCCGLSACMLSSFIYLHLDRARCIPPVLLNHLTTHTNIKSPTTSQVDLQLLDNLPCQLRVVAHLWLHLKRTARLVLRSECTVVTLGLKLRQRDENLNKRIYLLVNILRVYHMKSFLNHRFRRIRTYRRILNANLQASVEALSLVQVWLATILT